MGYWESAAIYEFHERLLASAASEWQDWRAFPNAWFDSQTTERLSQDLISLLTQEFDDAPLFVVKDPRVCRLVPFWLQTLASANVKPAALVSVRHPAEVARSLQARDGFGLERSLVLWLRHTLDAEYHTRAVPRCFVRYQDLLSDWRAVAHRIAVDLGVAWPHSSPADTEEIEAFLRPELHHHRANSDPLEPGLLLSGWLQRTWSALLLLLDSKPRVDEAAQILDNVRREFETVASVFGPILDDERREYRTRSADLRAELGAAKTRLAELNDAVELLRKESRHLLGINESLTADLARRTQESVHLRSDLTGVRRALEECQSDASQARCRIDELLASQSWRLTSPLRAIAALILRLPK